MNSELASEQQELDEEFTAPLTGYATGTEELSKIKEFSRDQHPNERNQVAQEIRAKRSTYFARQHNLESNIIDRESVLTEKQQRVDEVAAKIKELEAYLDTHCQNIFQKITHFFDIRNNRRELGKTKVEAEVLFQEAHEINAALEDLRNQKLDRLEISEAREALNEFYQGESAAWHEYEEEEKARDVKNVCLDNNCAMVHGIHPSFTPFNNSLLDQGTSWQEKLKILLALEPTVSASTVQDGDNGNHNL